MMHRGLHPVSHTWNPSQGCRSSWWHWWPLGRRKRRRRQRSWRSCHSWRGEKYKKRFMWCSDFKSVGGVVYSHTAGREQTWRLCTLVGTSRQRSRGWRAAPRGWRGPGRRLRTGPRRTWPGRRRGWGAACKCRLDMNKTGRNNGRRREESLCYRAVE